MSLEDLLHPCLDLYFGSPQWLKNALGKTYAQLGVVMRGPHYAGFAAEAALTDPHQAHQLGLAKLRASLQWALQSVPAYQGHRDLLRQLDTPLALLAQLPLVSKETLRANLPRYLSTRTGRRQRLTVATGGSTALPMTFYLEAGISRAKEYAFIEAFQRSAGQCRDDVVLSLRGRAVPNAGRASAPLWTFEPIKRELMLSCAHLAPQHMPAHLQAIRRWRPTFIQAYPSALHPLARWLEQHPAPEITEPIRAVMLFSENLLAPQRRLFNNVFNCPVLAHYGHAERLVMAASRRDDERYFFYPQYGHVELLDRAGRPVTQPGQLGEIVGTGFDNRVTNFIRYRTGDMALLAPQADATLSLPPVLESIEGRQQEFLVCRDHRLISINALTTPGFDDLNDADDIQFEQDAIGHLLVKVVSRRPFSSARRERLARALEQKTQGGCTAQLIEVEVIPRTRRGKHVMLVQHLDTSGYFGATPTEAA